MPRECYVGLSLHHLSPQCYSEFTDTSKYVLDLTQEFSCYQEYTAKCRRYARGLLRVLVDRAYCVNARTTSGVLVDLFDHAQTSKWSCDLTLSAIFYQKSL
jgi:hypothetical protein